MKTISQTVEEGFYQRCAELLGTTHTYKPWNHHKITRWNNRKPGNGRFPGCGTIKMFGPNVIHVALRHPKVITKVCKSPDEVYMILAGLSA